MSKFSPKYTVTPDLAKALMRVEALRQEVEDLPISPVVLARLRETARLVATHYSTQIEGNRLTIDEIDAVLFEKQHITGRERDESEVKGYYEALEYVRKLVEAGDVLTEEIIQRLHALVLGGGKKRVKPTAYRDGQNVIRDGRTGMIVYLPPEAKDVPGLMAAMVDWLNTSTLPVPLIAGIAHYQFATVHPYYDGNGRVARLLATLILHKGGYSLKGIYALDAYYAQDLGTYYDSLTVGVSHNYYLGRAEADITNWVEYFCLGMAQAVEKVRDQAKIHSLAGGEDQAKELMLLDAKKRKSLELFVRKNIVTAKDLGDLFGYKPRTASKLCNDWVADGFLVIVDPSRKARTYSLAPPYLNLLKN